MLDDLPQQQFQQTLQSLLMSSSGRIEFFQHLLLIISINRHSEFVKDQFQT